MKCHKTLFFALLTLVLLSCQNNNSDPQKKNLPDPNLEQMPTPDPKPDRPDPKPDRSGPSVYFIGNSLTYVYNIPGLFDAHMKNNKATLKSGDAYKGYIQTTPGAGRIVTRLGGSADSNAIFHIFTKKPRYIVLQEQSSGLFVNRTEHFIHHFFALAATVQAEIVLYQTWHTDSIIQNYRNVAKTYRATLLPAGEIWQALEDMEAPISSPDRVHQNRFGSEVIAKAFYYLLNGSDLSVPNDPYDRVIFDRVHDASDAEIQLRGLGQTPAGSGGIRYTDDVGDTLETAMQLNLSPQTNKIHVSPYDVDIYLLPTTNEGQSLQLTAIDGTGLTGYTFRGIVKASDVVIPASESSYAGSSFISEFQNRQPFQRSIIGLATIFFDEDSNLLRYETTGESSNKTAVIIKLHTTPNKKNYMALVMGDFRGYSTATTTASMRLVISQLSD